MSDERDEQIVPGGTATVSEVELLSTCVGKVEGKTTLILAIRPHPEHSFRFLNFGISKAQARRLLDDLSLLFQTSAQLNEPDEPGPGSERKTDHK
jgi:hypothetical protein